MGLTNLIHLHLDFAKIIKFYESLELTYLRKKLIDAIKSGSKDSVLGLENCSP